jgi:hypothetical protein
MTVDQNAVAPATGVAPQEKAIEKPPLLAAPADPANGMIPAGHPEEETSSGSEDYLTTLARIHHLLGPSLYLEIGVREGRSLALARGTTIGIDPAIKLSHPMPGAALFHETSDEFFESHAETVIDRPLDMAFIDGLHLFEYALRDFRNVEARASSGGLVVVDDIFPNCGVQGSRFRRTRAWTGDVWRLVDCLVQERPDLILLRLDCAPAGLMLIAGLDPSNDVLWTRYDAIIDRHLSTYLDGPRPDVLARGGAIEAGDPMVGDLLATLRTCRRHHANPTAVRRSLDEYRNRYRIRSEVRSWSPFTEVMRNECA